MDEVREEAKKYPGCKLKGFIGTIMKVNGVLYIGFRDHKPLYDSIKRSQTVDLSYDLKKFIFGEPESLYDLTKELSVYKPEIERELNPVKDDPPHMNGRFVARHDLHIFPIQFRSDKTQRTISSFEYTFTKKFEPIDMERDESQGKFPAVAFQMDFLPTISRYHLKKTSMMELWVDILSLCGGLFSVIGIVNSMLGEVAKTLVKARD